MATAKENPNAHSKIITVYIFFQILGFAILVLTSVWLTRYLDGFEWNGTAKQLNVHALSLVIGMVFLFGNAIVVFKVFTNEKKLHVKIVHTILHGLALVTIVVGLVATTDYYRAHKILIMYSIHGWFGVITVSLYALQFLIAMFRYCFPNVGDAFWATYFPLHNLFGEIIFALVGVTVVTGLYGRIILKYPIPKYESLPAGAAFGNAIGLIVVLYIITGILMIDKTPSKSKKADNDNDNEEKMKLIPLKP